MNNTAESDRKPATDEPDASGSSQIILQDIVYELDTWRYKARRFPAVIPFDTRSLRQSESDDHY